MNAHTIVNKLLEVTDPDDPNLMIQHIKLAEVCPHCGGQEYVPTSGFVSPRGTTIQNYYCLHCRREFVSQERKTELVGEAVDPDDPEAFVQHHILPGQGTKIETIEVQGRRWFRRGAGGTYNTASIYVNDQKVHDLDMQYGYGDHYLWRAFDWLENNGYFVRERYGNSGMEAPWMVAQRMGFKLLNYVTDVKRQRDL